jgi:hypothetical protein
MDNIAQAFLSDPLACIFDYLPVIDILQSAISCRSWRSFLSEPYQWQYIGSIPLAITANQAKAIRYDRLPWSELKSIKIELNLLIAFTKPRAKHGQRRLQSFEPLDPHIIRYLSQLLSFGSLTAIDLTDCFMDENLLSILLNSHSSLQLKQLNLTSAGLTLSAGKYLNQCSNLETLILNDLTHFYNVNNALAACKQCNRLKRLEISIENNRHLVMPSVSNIIDNSGVQAICDNSPNLTYLSIPGSFINNDAVDYLTQKLAQLTHLNLNNCTTITNSISNYICRLKSLQYLDFSACPQISATHFYSSNASFYSSIQFVCMSSSEFSSQEHAEQDNQVSKRSKFLQRRMTNVAKQLPADWKKNEKYFDDEYGTD